MQTRSGPNLARLVSAGSGVPGRARRRLGGTPFVVDQHPIHTPARAVDSVHAAPSACWSVIDHAGRVRRERGGGRRSTGDAQCLARMFSFRAARIEVERVRVGRRGPRAAVHAHRSSPHTSTPQQRRSERSLSICTGRIRFPVLVALRKRARDGDVSNRRALPARRGITRLQVAPQCWSVRPASARRRRISSPPRRELAARSAASATWPPPSRRSPQRHELQQIRC